VRAEGMHECVRRVLGDDSHAVAPPLCEVGMMRLTAMKGNSTTCHCMHTRTQTQAAVGGGRTAGVPGGPRALPQPLHALPAHTQEVRPLCIPTCPCVLVREEVSMLNFNTISPTYPVGRIRR
jgi:hypothetical protein